MKTFIDKTFVVLMVSVMMANVTSIQAQTAVEDFITVSGVVKNQQNRKVVEYASVSVKGTNVGTVTNEDGEFTLKIKKSLTEKAIVISHIGYVSTVRAMEGDDTNNLAIWLIPQKNMLDEVVVEAAVSRNIVREAIKNISKNYEHSSSLLTGFYRETARKRSHFINISEAVVNMYKTGYQDRNADFDRVQIIKGRKLLSEKSGDTLGVRLLGGPNLSLYMDIVKNPDELLDESTLNYYDFKMEKSVYIDRRQQYVISFRPIVSLPYALFIGKYYIDKESLAFTRIEMSMDMSDRNKVTTTILRKKPFGLIFKPQELFFLINYKERNGQMCLNYIRNEVRFKCDWKKKFFHTEYGITSEMVVTDMQNVGVEKIPYKESFRENDSFTDKVRAFYDEDFWGAYNILAPTESLDKAVMKLKKQHQDQQD